MQTQDKPATEAQEAAQTAAEKAAESTTEAVEKTKDAAGKVAEKAGEAAEKAQDAAGKVAEKAGEAAEKAQDAAGKAAGKAAEKVAEGGETAVEAAGETVEKAAETIENVAGKGAEAAGEAAENSGEAAAEGASNLAENFDQAAEVVGLNSHSMFLLGLGLLGLFVWYFASEAPKRRRLIGSILAVVVAGLCTMFFQNYGVEEGIELQGGVSMEIRIVEVEGRTITSETQQQVIEILEKRLNALGAKEVILAPSGKEGVFLQVPGVGPDALREMEEVIQKVAKLEFSIVHPESRFRASQIASGGQPEPGFESLPYRLSEKEKEANVEAGLEANEPNRWELVKIKKDMTGKNVRSAKYYYGPKGHSISVDFTTKGASIMGPLTNEHQGEQLAIIMDSEVISAPNIEEPFSMGCSITGDFSQEEAKALVAALENPLENPIEIDYSNYISPTMGELTVAQGKNAGIAGLVITLLFIIAYYRFAGMIALVGLLLNIVIIFGALALFRFTLTMPGIAGIILTIGVAIDSNVLIYERLREELKGGKSLKAAIDAAYEKAFSAIIDANITTLITAVILYFLATGTVKGFAITLIIGIIASLFSCLIVTRACFGWASESFLKQLSFMNIIPEKLIDFLGKRKTALMVSLALVGVSVVVLPVLDPRGVELKGGDKITIQDSAGLSKEAIIESLGEIDLGAAPIVQEQQSVGGDGKFFMVRAPDNTANLVQDQLAADLGVDPNRTETSSVGSQIGKSMLVASGIALLVGILAILLYVTFRFEFAFALGAIVALFHDLIITLGVTTLLGQEMTLITVGALLTIAGYSINDTIVVFDRVREGLATKRGDVKDIMNLCLNATLARTILTSMTTLIIVIVLFLFGGPGMRNFALTLIVGVLIGTYSSIFVASPIVLWWSKRSGTNLRRAVLDTEQSKVDPLATA